MNSNTLPRRREEKVHSEGRWFKKLGLRFHSDREEGLTVGGVANALGGILWKSGFTSSLNRTQSLTLSWALGHSFQTFGILCRVSGYYFCVPICARIHEGIVRSNRDRKTLIDKAGMMLKDAFGDEHSFVLIADAYYANGKMLKSQAATGSQLITRVLSNTVAYEPPAPVAGKRKRGRPKKYGRKRTLSSLFGPTTEFTKLNCPVYGEVVCMCAMLALICSALETNRRHGAFCSGRAPIQRAHDSYVFGSLALSWANHRALFFAL